MLEEAPPEDAPGPDGGAREAGQPRGPARRGPARDGHAEAADAAPDLPFDISRGRSSGPPRSARLVQQEEHEETRFENFVGTPTSLADHLDEQLRLTVGRARRPRRRPRRSSATSTTTATFAPPSRRSPRSGASRSRSSSRPSSWCRASIPSGVAARDLRECLLIQLRDPPRARPRTRWPSQILDQHFEALPALQVSRDRPRAQGRPGARDRGRRTRSPRWSRSPGAASRRSRPGTWFPTSW